MATDVTSGFEIDGISYGVPSLESLNMDEAMVMYEYSEITIEDFAPDQEDGTMSDEREEELAGLVKNPGFVSALLHIAIQRGNPDWKKPRVKGIVGRTSLLTALEGLAGSDEEGDQPDPPASTPELRPSSDPSLGGLSKSSGSGSETSLDVPDENPEPTGTIESPTFPTPLPETSDTSSQST